MNNNWHNIDIFPVLLFSGVSLMWIGNIANALRSSPFDERKLRNFLSTFRTYQILFKSAQSLPTAEWTMRIQRESGAGSAEKGETRADDCADPGENPDARPSEIIGMPEPPPPPRRWLPQRKAEVMDAVRGGFLSLDDALDRYALSIDEYLAWQRRIGLFGLAGLRVNGTQPHRRVRTRPAKH